MNGAAVCGRTAEKKLHQSTSRTGTSVFVIMACVWITAWNDNLGLVKGRRHCLLATAFRQDYL